MDYPSTLLEKRLPHATHDIIIRFVSEILKVREIEEIRQQR